MNQLKEFNQSRKFNEFKEFNQLEEFRAFKELKHLECFVNNWKNFEHSKNKKVERK